MTLYDIIMEYNRKKDDGWNQGNENYYADMRKKLLRAFECLGLYDLSFLKSENNKDYDFFDSDKGYIFYLFDKEGSKLYKTIRNNAMTNEDYLMFVEEIEALFRFIKPHVSSDEEYQDIVNEISSNTRYPLLKRYYNTRGQFEDFVHYYNSIVSDNGALTGLENWLYLTQDDKLKLFDELMSSTNKWIELVKAVGECRAEESWNGFDELTTDDIDTYCFVENAIADEYLSRLKNIPVKVITKSRNFKSKIKKIDKQDSEACKLKMEIAKKYCEEHNIDFYKYLDEKVIAETYEQNKVSTDELFKQIKIL